MEYIKFTEEFLTRHKIWLEITTALGALVFGLWQIKINFRLKKLQDFVAVAAVPDSRSNKINLLNTGKTNLYLWGFDTPDNKQRLKKPRLISSGTADQSYYWINPPSNIKDGEEFEFCLYLEDEFGEKWISEHGGRADTIEVEKDGKKITGLGIKVWSYRIYKKKWSFQ